MNRSGVIGAVARFYQRSYAGDWIALGTLWAARVLVRTPGTMWLSLLMPVAGPKIRVAFPSHVLAG